jgi:hypothetical protein
MEILCFSETLASTYEPVTRQNPEQQHRHGRNEYPIWNEILAGIRIRSQVYEANILTDFFSLLSNRQEREEEKRAATAVKYLGACGTALVRLPENIRMTFGWTVRGSAPFIPV